MTDVKPTLNSELVTRLNWADEFDGDLIGWNDEELIESARHRTGNKYIQPDGTIDLDKPWHKIPGRWAALYDLYREECQFIRDGHLVMKGFAVETPNPYRDNFEYAGETHRYGDYMLYTSWLTHLRTISKGSVIEVRVNFENQVMRGHRWNLWGMPADHSASAYDTDISTVEIDIEVENPSRVDHLDFGSGAMLKVVAGGDRDTPEGFVDLRKFGVDLRKGWHTFTIVWGHDGSLQWYVDSIRCQSDMRAFTGDIELIMAREMNSGVKSADSESWQNREDGPMKPIDPGLTGQSVILDVDLIEDDEVLIDYVRVFDIIEGETTEKVEIEESNPVQEALSDARSALDRLEKLIS